MSKFTDHLWRDLVQEHGPTLAQVDRPEPGRAGGRLPPAPARSRGQHARAGGGRRGAGARPGRDRGNPPAFAITTNSDGSVLVHLNYTTDQNLPQVDAKLASMGIHENVGIQMAPGPATVTGPVTCTPTGG